MRQNRAVKLSVYLFNNCVFQRKPNTQPYLKEKMLIIFQDLQVIPYICCHCKNYALLVW